MERFPNIDTDTMRIEDMIAMLQAEGVMETEGLGILGLDRSMDMITPESVDKSVQRISRGDTQWGEVPEEIFTGYGKYNKGGRIGYQGGIGPNQGSPSIMAEAITDTEVEDAYGVSLSKSFETYENDYGGKYDGVMEGEHLIYMRKAIEDLAAGKITQKVYNEIKESFLNEFPESAINILKKEVAIAQQGLRKGGRIGLDEGGMPWEKRSSFKKKKNKKGKRKFDPKKKRWILDEEGSYEDFTDSLSAAQEGLERLEEQKIKPLPIRPLTLASGGDVDDVMEFDEEIITPNDLIKEEGVAIGEQVSSPNAMDDLNQLSLDMFGKPVFELSEDEFEALQDLASQQVLKPGLIDDYRNYKYQMEEQGMTPMSPRDYFRNEWGAARMGVKKGGLMNLGGKEMDLRGGGFVPLGAKERADDVPARLSRNEFVMTADAVRGAGGGNVQQGADLMYNQMKQLEAKG